MDNLSTGLLCKKGYSILTFFQIFVIKILIEVAAYGLIPKKIRIGFEISSKTFHFDIDQAFIVTFMVTCKRFVLIFTYLGVDILISANAMRLSPDL